MDDVAVDIELNCDSQQFSRSVSTTLLYRIKMRDESAWAYIYELFEPVVSGWTISSGLQHADRAEVVQRVFTTVNRRIDRFEREHHGQSFRGWLWTITKYQILDFYREQKSVGKAVGGTTNMHRWSLLDETFEDDHSVSGRQELSGVLERCISLVKDRVEPNTWTAFWKTTVECQPASELAASLNVSKWTIYKAKSRVLKLLRAELDGLVDLDLLLHTPSDPSENQYDRPRHGLSKPK